MSPKPLGATPAEVTAELTARVGRRFRRSSSAMTIPRYVVLTELGVDSVETRRDVYGPPADGIVPEPDRWGAAPYKRRRIDVLAIGQWGPIAGHVEGVEVKATRSDLLAELRDPLKAEAGARYCHRWWLAVADLAILDGLDLPARWGVLAPHGRGLKVHRAAALIDPLPMPARLVATITAAAVCQAVPNYERGARALALDVAARYPSHAEPAAWAERLDAQHRQRFDL